MTNGGSAKGHSDLMYWRLRYRMYKAVRDNVLGIGELGLVTPESIRVRRFLFPEENIIKDEK